MSIITNPIVVSVLLLCALCLMRVNVLLALLLAAITAGVTGGVGLTKSMDLLTAGFSTNATTALSYILHLRNRDCQYRPDADAGFLALFAHG